MSVGCVTTEYLIASYKGVMFQAEEAGSEHGRRGAVGEFPFGENTAYADLGRKNRTYSIKARFVENSHLQDVDALIAAVESPGPGVLVHPTRGIVTAACKSMKVEDKVIEEQGVSYAELEFIEANDWPAGMSLIGDILGTPIAGILTAVADVFLTNYDPSGVPYHRRRQVLDAARGQIAAVRSEIILANRGTADVKILRALADYDTIMADDALLSRADIVNSAISGGMASLGRTLTGSAKFTVMRRIANGAANVSSLPGVARQSEDAVYVLTRTVAGAHMAQSAMEQKLSNVDEVLAAMDAASEVLRSEGEIAYALCENALFLEIRRYLVSFRAQLYGRAYRLPGVVLYNFGGGVHPLVAAYQIYGDAKRLRELEIGNVINDTGRFNNVVAAVN